MFVSYGKGFSIVNIQLIHRKICSLLLPSGYRTIWIMIHIHHWWRHRVYSKHWISTVPSRSCVTVKPSLFGIKEITPFWHNRFWYTKRLHKGQWDMKNSENTLLKHLDIKEINKSTLVKLYTNFPVTSVEFPVTVMWNTC